MGDPCNANFNNLKDYNSPMNTMKSSWLGLVVVQAVLLPTGCFEWKYDISERGAAFSKVRYEENGLIIGALKEDTVIGGRPCKQGWVHICANGVPVGFTASREIDLGRFEIPSETWVLQDQSGVVTVCAFPRDTEIQGHLCRGNGGPKGVQTAFYPSGALKQYFLRRDTRVQGILCRRGLFNEFIELYENGALKGCVLGEDLMREGRRYAKGTHLQFDPKGQVVP
jgi:hypothetical protein